MKNNSREPAQTAGNALERSFDYAIVAEGEGAGIAVGSGELHDHLHDFMCCCGKPWENCATDSVREDIARTDNPDEWTLDEQGREFSISWKYETGRTTVYRNYCGRCVISWQDPAMASSQEAATPECPGGDLCDGDLPGEWHEKSCPCYRDEVDGVMMRDWEARKPALQAEFDEWKSASRVAEPAPSPATKETPPINDELIAEIARELYDRFLMGGWEPQDAYPQIRTWLSYSSATPAKCEKCNAKSAKEACHMCIGGGGNCPIVDAGWVKDWPTQVEFEDAQTASSQGPAREETPPLVTALRQKFVEIDGQAQMYSLSPTADPHKAFALNQQRLGAKDMLDTMEMFDAGAKSVVAAPQLENGHNAMHFLKMFVEAGEIEAFSDVQATVIYAAMAAFAQYRLAGAAALPLQETCPSCQASDHRPYIDSQGQKMRACGRCMIQWVTTLPASSQ